jgi:hypothetical protein
VHSFRKAASEVELVQDVVMHTIDYKMRTNVATAAVNAEGSEARDNQDEQTLEAQYIDSEDLFGDDDIEEQQTQYCA